MSAVKQSTLKNIEAKVTGGMAFLSALLLLAIVALFVFEIFMRYTLNSPTRFSSDFIAFMMPAMIFLALPEVTRRNQHIAITSLIDSLKPTALHIWRRVIALIAAVVSLLIGYIMTLATLKQFNGNIMTNTVIQIPKWAVTTPIALSFTVVTIIFVITACTGRDS